MKFQLPDMLAEETNRMESIIEKGLTGSNLRESIIRSELKDFKELEDLSFLEDLKTIVFNRYKLERRNSLNPKVEKKFLAFCDSLNELSNFVESQSSFYERRIIEIESELKNYEG